MYQALYRKWRPKTFSEVIGQDHITQTLQRQVAEGRISHAYLFTGTRGTGKTTCAKILAKAVNCEHPEDGNPCGKCPSCQGIDSGLFLDVQELDAASNNGVDQVRALQDEAVYTPANVKMRVYIVDEVHMLTPAAFNALLKILEEPPEHLMFILATTEIHKVPATILSRCQRFSFRRIQPRDIARRLALVAKEEGIELEAGGVEIISRLADGALRDALSLLDQCAAAGGAIDAPAVLEVLGLAGNLQTAEMMEHILNRDAQAALLLLDRLYHSGKDMGAVLSELSVLVRDLLLRLTAPEGGAALLSGGYDNAALDRLGRGAPASRFLYLADTLQRASASLYASVNRRLDTELCILRLCDEALCGDLTALEARVQRLEEEGLTAQPVQRRVEPAPAPAPEPEKKPAPPPVRKAPEAPPAPKPPEPMPKPAPADTPPWEESAPTPPKEAPVQEDAPLWDDLDAPPLPEPPPPRDEPGERYYDIPEDLLEPASAPPPKKPGPKPAPPAQPREPEPVQAEPEPPEPVKTEALSPAVPEAPPPQSAGAPVLDGAGWRTLAEKCKGRLPPMYRAFLEMCTGVMEGGLLILFSPNEITQGRLDNDRVRSVLREEAEALLGTPVRITFRVGEPKPGAPQENLKSLLKFGRQFDNVDIQ